ncbi:hypothetical protein EGT07_24835 [Herbaspirillum sp. HC18]|nr:hypothetical protein EGT07_24835 [Herbaspirillum sp. HC18]
MPDFLLQAFRAKEQFFQFFLGQWLNLRMRLKIVSNSSKRCLILFRYGLEEFEELNFFLSQGLAIIGARFVLQVSRWRRVCHVKSSGRTENPMILTALNGSNNCSALDDLLSFAVAEKRRIAAAKYI